MERFDLSVKLWKDLSFQNFSSGRSSSQFFFGEEESMAPGDNSTVFSAGSKAVVINEFHDIVKFMLHS